MCFLIFTFLFTNLVILGFIFKKKPFYKIQVQRIYFQPPPTTDCGKQVPNYQDVVASKRQKRNSHDTADLSALLEQNHTVSFRDPPVYLSVKLCVYECMHMFGTVVWDLGKNMHVFNKENVHFPFVCILTKEYMTRCVFYWIILVFCG